MIEFAILGLGTGALYALGALGIVCIHRGSKVLNLAHGAVAAWGAYLFVNFHDDRGMPAILAAALAVIGCGCAGALIYLTVIQPIRARTPLTKMIMTLGLAAVLDGTAVLAFGTQTLVVNSSLPTTSVDILGAHVGWDRIVILGIGVVVTFLLAAWSSRARLPLATRALSEHERGAVALGHSPHVLGAVNWALGSALAGLAGLLLVPIVGLAPGSVDALIIPSLAAALLGRFDSYWLALVGGLAIGVAEGLIQYFVAAPGWSYAAPIGLIIVALYLQHQKGMNRLAAMSAPAVGAGRIRLVPALVALAITITFIMNANAVWAAAGINSICFVILSASLVILIGYANQISLAQMAIAGLGALTAARLSIDLNVPFILLPITGAIVGCLVGFLVGLPSMRVRGINLAVVTLGLGLAVENIIFDNPAYTGGYAGLNPASPDIFGVSINAAVNPRGYALFALFWAVLAVLVVMWVRRSRLGRELLAMRTNERAASSMGINVRRVKLLAFMISASMAGMAGVLLGYQSTTITFFSFTYAASLSLVAIVVIAGVGSILGSIVGGLLAAGGIVFQLVSGLSFVANQYALITGIGLVWTILAHPNGLTFPPRREPRPDPARLPDGEGMPRTPRPLEAEGIVVRFGGVRAVDRVSLRVKPGEVVGLIGPNGAGKTTLLDALGGFAQIAEGSVRLGDIDMTRASAHVRASAGMARVFQGAELFDDLTVAQNLLLGAEVAGHTGGRLPRAAREAMENFGLAGSLQRRPTGLSLAQRKLVSVVRALAANPAVLMLDEPGAGLSMTVSQQFGQGVAQLAKRQGLGVLIVDHDMGLVMSSCDRILVMQEGAVIAEGTPESVRADPRVRAAYLGEMLLEEIVDQPVPAPEKSVSRGAEPELPVASERTRP
jgi:ABC-type branched-subunit amino acid transport system ATPase component/branched-subunit amino acid ABC-type transport system permease component